MLNFDFLKKGPEIVSLKGSGNSFSNTFCEWIFKKNVSQVILTDQISLPDCLYFSRYWSLCVLQLFVSQVVTS